MFDLNNSIVICPKNYKDLLVRKSFEEKKIQNIKFLSKEEVLEGLTFSFDIDAIYEVSKIKNCSLELAKEIISNLRFIKPNPSNQKLNDLYNLYLDLKTRNIITFNSYFIHLLRNRPINIVGYSKQDKELTSLLDNNGIKYNYVSIDVEESFTHSYIEFETINDEVDYAFRKIMSLISKGVSLNNIYLFPVNNETNLLINKQIEAYDLPVELNEQNPLYDSPIFKIYLENCKSSGLKDAFNMFNEKEYINEDDIKIKLSSIVSRIISYKFDKEDELKILEYLSKNTFLKSKQYKESIKIINEHSFIDGNSYVFILDFSSNNYPKAYFDNDFYSDEEKQFLGLNTSLEQSILDKSYLINFLNRTKNIFLYCQNFIGKSKTFLSPLVKELGYIKDNINETNIRYSTKLATFEMSDYKDINRIYGYENPYMDGLKQPLYAYLDYDHHFKGLSSYDPNVKICLSYSSINTYNECPYKYFLNKVLKANIFEERFTTNLGTLFHKILQDSVGKQISIDDYQSFIDEKFTTKKDRFFMRLLLPQIFTVIKKNENFVKDSKFKKILTEETINVNVDPQTLLTGTCDKLMFDEEKKMVIVVDYKTYGFSFDAKKLKYGLNLQLPIYGYLLEKQYSDYKVVGEYIQNVLVNKKKLNDKKEMPFLLNGFTINDDAAISRLDTSFGNVIVNGKPLKKSQYISNISSRKTSTILDEAVFADYKKIAEDFIISTNKAVREGKFPINPHKEKNSYKNDCCDFCGCRSICFVDDKDITYLNLKEDATDE